MVIAADKDNAIFWEREGVTSLERINFCKYSNKSLFFMVINQ